MTKSEPMKTVTLTDPADPTRTVKVLPTIPSGKVRVELAKLAAATPTIDAKARKIAEKAMIAKGEADEVIREMIRSGEVTFDDVVNAGKESPETVEARLMNTVEMFRVCARIPEEWADKVNDDEFMLAQDITEVEAFIESFRKRIGI